MIEFDVTQDRVMETHFARNSIVVLILSVCSICILILVTCLYCFGSSPDKYDDAETENEAERGNIKTPNSLPDTKGGPGHLWRKVNYWFSGNDKNGTQSSEFSRSSKNNSLYDQPPTMGTISVRRVQPPQRQISMSYSAGSSDGNTGTNGHRSRFTSSSYIPEGFKLPFELSFDNNEEPPTEYLGKVEFSTKYAFADNSLSVKVIRAYDLPAMDLSGTSDPFVKCCLLPDRKRKLETKIRHKTLNPTWHENLSFEGLTYEKIQQRVLYLQVLDYDRFSRNDPIGEILVPLHTINLAEELVQCLHLAPCKGSNKRGELQLSLCYQPIEGILDIGIIKGRNLKPMDLNGTSDPYVKIWLLHRGKRIEKKKTAIVRNSLDPDFGEEFTFSAPMDRLRDIQVEITVMDHDTIGRNDTIGKKKVEFDSLRNLDLPWSQELWSRETPLEGNANKCAPPSFTMAYTPGLTNKSD